MGPLLPQALLSPRDPNLKLPPAKEAGWGLGMEPRRALEPGGGPSCVWGKSPALRWHQARGVGRTHSRLSPGPGELGPVYAQVFWLEKSPKSVLEGWGECVHLGGSGGRSG